ncbi:MAG: SprT-like domain-containing protein [Dehalococcoidia bacterium]
MTQASAPPATTRQATKKLLVALCQEHGIAPVPALEWSKRMRHTLGRAFMRDGLIRLSAWLDEQQAENTLRHELAHIAVGAGRRIQPHGTHWRAWAERLGAEPRAAARRAPANAPPSSDSRLHWGLECPSCGIRLVRFRVLRGLYHRGCGPNKGKLVRALRGPHHQVLAWAGSQP